MRFDKRGISAIVATVLIILVTVAAVTIIWVAIIPMIQEKFGFIDADARVDVVTSGGYTVYDEAQNIMTVKVKRATDEVNMPRVKITVMFADGSYSSEVEAPLPNQEKVYGFNLTNTGHVNPLSVSVSPIIVVGNQEEEGIASSPSDFVENTIVNIPSELLNLSQDYTGPTGPCDGVTGCTNGDGCCYPGCNPANDDDCGILEPSAISYWDFEGDLLDGVDGNDMTKQLAVQIVSGGLFGGQALDFPAAGYAETSGAVMPAGSNIVSYGGWIRWDTYGDAIPTYGSDLIMVQSNSFDGGYELWSYSDVSNNWAGCWDGNNETYASLTKDHEWHHVMCVHNGTNMMVYIDGAFGAGRISGDTVDDEPFRLGNAGEEKCQFNGTLDEVVVFSKALDITEIGKLVSGDYSAINDNFYWL